MLSDNLERSRQNQCTAGGSSQVDLSANQLLARRARLACLRCGSGPWNRGKAIEFRQQESQSQAPETLVSRNHANAVHGAFPDQGLFSSHNCDEQNHDSRHPFIKVLPFCSVYQAGSHKDDTPAARVAGATLRKMLACMQAQAQPACACWLRFTLPVVQGAAGAGAFALVYQCLVTTPAKQLDPQQAPAGDSVSEYDRQAQVTSGKYWSGEKSD